MKIGEHTGEAHKITATVEDIRAHGFGDRPAFRVLVAEVDGRFAGICLWFASFSTWRGRPGVYVQDLFVEAAFRGRKVGETLLKSLAARVRAEGGVYIRLSVDRRNGSAQRFYDRMGFGVVDDDMICAAYGDAFDALAAGGDDR